MSGAGAACLPGEASRKQKPLNDRPRKMGMQGGLGFHPGSAISMPYPISVTQVCGCS